MILKTIKSLIMPNKKVKKQSVKSSIKNKTSKKPKKSGGASKAAASKPAAKMKKSAAPSKVATAPKKHEEKNKKVSPAVSEKETAKKADKPVSSAIPATPKPAKAATGKKSKTAKAQKPKEGGDLEDDFLADDVEGIEDIGEYEEELKAVEEADDEPEDETAWELENKENTEDEIILTDAEGRRYCRARDCDQISAVDAYCRYHYLLFWKKIQVRKKILLDGKLERYVEELTGRFPDKFLEMIRRDLRTTKDFLSAIQELEIDESANGDDFEEESQSFIDEVRGLNESPGVDEEEF